MTNARALRLALGTVISLGIVLGTAYLSSRPAWQSLPDTHGLIRLSFAKSGVRDCRDRTEAELAALPQNMRSRQVCDSRRAPVYVELDLNGKTVLAESLAPSGLSGTGPSRVYRRFELPAGDYEVAVRLRDDPAVTGFTSTAMRRVTLAPAQSVAIDFDAESGFFFE